MISIAMTTYNGEKYLKEQLDSILSQSYDDFELIICDDCSKDDTRKILSEYKNKDNRIKIEFNEKNLGFIKNFDKAIRLCSGDFIAMSDQDDVWTENHLEILLNNIGNHYLICSNAELVDSDGKSLNDFVRPDGFTVCQNGDEQIIQQLVRNVVQGCTALFRKELIKYFFPIPETAIAHDTWLGDIACLAPAENGLEGLTYIHESVLKYRQHGSNTIGVEAASVKRNINHFNKSSFSHFNELKTFMDSDSFSFVTDEHKKNVLKETRKYISNLSSRKKRMKAFPFFFRHAVSIYAVPRFNLYVLGWFIKLFVLFK